MLYINKEDDVILPQEFHKLNNLCAILYDQIAECFNNPEYVNLFKTNFEFDREQQTLVDELINGEIDALEWLRVNDFNDDLAKLVSKHVAIAIISDFSHFVYESLSCAKRGKTTVAYSLLRKPFTDELLMLEQLFFDSKEFVDRFYHSGNPDEYDPSSRTIDKKQIIKNSIGKIDGNYIFTEDFLFDLRYNKEMTAGLNGISNQAIHIVTRDRNYKTENQGLNFLFFKEKDVHIHWKHFYSFVPYLLLYSATVIDEILFDSLPGEQNEKVKSVKKFRRFLGMLFWSEWTNFSKGETSKKMFNLMSENIQLDCQNCNDSVDLIKADFILFYEAEIFLCPTCFQNLMLFDENVNAIQDFIENI